MKFKDLNELVNYLERNNIYYIIDEFDANPYENYKAIDVYMDCDCSEFDVLNGNVMINNITSLTKEYIIKHKVSKNSIQ